MFNNIYRGKKVFLTGHTGFKGSWMSLWLKSLGSEILGYSLPPNTNPNHFEITKPDIKSVYGDIRDREFLNRTMSEFKPDIVFHLAAQPLVRYSYSDPVETYETNVIGTLNVFEASRHTGGAKAIVNITSDKCYENKEWIWGYRENDPMGGYDPYSSSKGCAELLAASYRNSYFNNADYGTKHGTLMASCRAGNVIGGGDWAMDRLMTDIMVAASKGETVSIRSPKATRPWQHVLEPLSGYLLTGQKLLEGDVSCAEGWNFGPGEEGSITVEQVCKYISGHWDRIRYEITPDASLHEAHLLKLDCSKAHAKLKWHSVWSSEETFKRTVEWYKMYYEQGKCITHEQLDAYTKSLTY